MKSENDLVITGIIVSVAPSNPKSESIRFRIAHNFGGKQEPLFLNCLLNLQSSMGIPQKGMHVRMRSYIRSQNGRIEVIVKSIEFNSPTQ